jgi:hypothetical protein
MIANTWVIEEGRFASKDEMRTKWVIFKKKWVKTHYGGATLSKEMYSFFGYILYYFGGMFSLISSSVLINI